MDSPQQPAPANPPNYIHNIDLACVSFSDGAQKVALTLTWKEDKRVESILLDIEIADEVCRKLAEKVMEARRRQGARQN